MAQVTMAISGKGQWSAYAKRVRDHTTYCYAEEYHNTARKAGSPIVRAYLLGHAIELYLKAFLLRAGMASSLLKSKRKYGHDLNALLTEAKSRGIGEFVRISPQMIEDLSKLNALYPETLRYFSLFHLLTQPSIPPLSRLWRLAKALSKGLHHYVAIKPSNLNSKANVGA
ncbi:MAG: hypothetical protein F9K47_16735 [Burkholderiales bacterium]|nr:MAG: hypothetical protein F9K47_16735 [Burkholderiales bacterium]